MSRHSFDLKTIGLLVRGELVVVMPIYNEEAIIASVIADWLRCFTSLGISFQILAIDDGSSDNTLSVLVELEAASPDQLCVVHKPNSGHGPTCRVGYQIAAYSETDWVLQIDSDGQCDPAEFPRFWSLREDHDCIFGIRERRDDGFARVMTSGMCRWMSSIICGRNLPDPNVPYRLMRTAVMKEALSFIPSSFNVHNVALTYVLKKTPGVRWTYLPIHFRERQGGENSISVLQVTALGAEMLLELARLRAPAGSRTGSKPEINQSHR